MVQLPVQATPTSLEDESNDIPNWDILGDEWLSDEPELESDLHREQIDLLLRMPAQVGESLGIAFAEVKVLL
jgi:hypothetical protein